MPKYIGLADVSLCANGEYDSSIDDVFLGVKVAADEESALEHFVSVWKGDDIAELGNWVQRYDYSIKVQEV